MDEQVDRTLTREEAIGPMIDAGTLHSFITESAMSFNFDDNTSSDYINGYRAALGDLEYRIDRALGSAAWRSDHFPR